MFLSSVTPIAIDNAIKHSTITPETVGQWTFLASRDGLALVISVVAILVVLSIFGTMMLMFKKMFNSVIVSNEKRETEFQKGLNVTMRELNNSINALEKKIQEIVYTLNFDTELSKKVEELKNRLDNFEISNKKNLFQYIKLVIQHLELRDACVNNPSHAKVGCGYPNDTSCGMMIAIRNKIKDSVNVFIIDDSIKAKISHILDSYMSPSVPIQNILHDILDEIENVLN